MKAFHLRSEGGGSVLEPGDVPVPEPKAGEVLVRIRAASLNRGEFLAARASAQPKPAGQEGAGEVAKVGRGGGPTHFKPGDRVMGRCGGAFAEYALMDAREAVPVPEGLSWEEAASVPLVFMVVHDMLIAQGKLQQGEWLLVTAVSSGVGVASVQVGKMLGAKVIGTSGSPGKLAKLEAIGLDIGIPVRGPGFADAVMTATAGKGANLVVNNVGGTVFAECMRALAFEGRFATVGTVDGVLRAEIDIEALHSKRLRLFGVSNRLRTPEMRAETVRGFVADVLPAIADGRIQPVIDRVFPFEALPDAKRYMESNAHLGKIVVRLER